MRKRLLREKDLTLDKTLEIAQIMESTDRLMEKYNNSDSLLNHQDSDNENVHHITSKMKKLKSTHHHKVDPPRSDDSEEDGVNRIHTRRNPYKKSAISSKGSKPYETQDSSTSGTFCYRCGHPSHLANKFKVAIGKTCGKCGKEGHLSRVCGQLAKSGRAKSASPYVSYIVADLVSSDDDFVLALGPSTPDTFQINVNQSTNVLIDSGSTVNVISKHVLDTLEPHATLQPYNRKVYSFHSKSPLPIEGVVDLPVHFQKHQLISEFVVVPSTVITILGRTDAATLNLLRVGPSADNICNY